MRDLGRKGDFGGKEMDKKFPEHKWSEPLIDRLILLLKDEESHIITVCDFVKRYGVLAHKSRQLMMLEFILRCLHTLIYV